MVHFQEISNFRQIFLGRGNILDVLERALASRNLDIRVLFWRNEKFFGTVNQFGNKKHIRLLQKRQPKIAIRWDSSGGDPAHCHHEKSWLIDVGQVRYLHQL